MSGEESEERSELQSNLKVFSSVEVGGSAGDLCFSISASFSWVHLFLISQ